MRLLRGETIDSSSSLRSSQRLHRADRPTTSKPAFRGESQASSDLKKQSTKTQQQQSFHHRQRDQEINKLSAASRRSSTDHFLASESSNNSPNRRKSDDGKNAESRRRKSADDDADCFSSRKRASEKCDGSRRCRGKSLDKSSLVQKKGGGVHKMGN